MTYKLSSTDRLVYERRLRNQLMRTKRFHDNKSVSSKMDTVERICNIYSKAESQTEYNEYVKYYIDRIVIK